MAGGNPNDHDFFSTHPSDSKRIAVMNELIVEIENQKDFYSNPVLSEVPTPKDEFKQSNFASGNKKYCQNCGTVADLSDRFCTNCGAKFEVELKCPNCGASVGSDDSFCTNCGIKLH
ncbi:zinc ribbon domain-containing protein [uncultured Methanobrevibacter sp.]|nr:zinc ribbon domain-containing protein [uncultured Methanobrevibacter sp.]